MIDIVSAVESVTNNPYLVSLIIFVLFVLFAKALMLITRKVVLKLTAKTKTKVDDLIVNSTYKHTSFLIILLGIRIAVIPLSFSESVALIVNRLLDSLLIVVVIYVVLIVLMILLNSWGGVLAKKTRTPIDDQLIKFATSMLKIIALALALIMILDLWGVEVGPLLASLGIVGIALAFGLQSTLGNIFGGISLILDKAIRKGDIVKLESGERGTVYDVGLRSTKIKTFDNQILVVPNDKLATTIVENYNLPDPTIRINIPFGVEYGSDPDQVKKVALATLKGVPHVIDDPAPKVWFTEMADFALNFKMMFYVDNLENKWDAHQEVITKLYNALRKNSIGIPFPTRTIYMKKG
ncbi:MAG: mechanosensitive ion channel family protein [Nanoarchaeota archaeon]|nr:mechanosensitive ion channel family protein [Nanoarchaeota archaeon]MBU1704325.1 mechanosensitive ion channel family protein [Nanoarchaeota archaeon]